MRDPSVRHLDYGFKRCFGTRMVDPLRGHRWWSAERVVGADLVTVTVGSNDES